MFYCTIFTKILAPKNAYLSKRLLTKFGILLYFNFLTYKLIIVIIILLKLHLLVIKFYNHTL